MSPTQQRAERLAFLYGLLRHGSEDHAYVNHYVVAQEIARLEDECRWWETFELERREDARRDFDHE